MFNISGIVCRILQRHFSSDGREKPGWETDAISGALINMFNCNVLRLPTELLTHTFWKMFGRHQSAKPFGSCVERSGVRNNSCLDILRDHCPSRFGANWTQFDECRRHLSSVARHYQMGGKLRRSLSQISRLQEQKMEHGDVFHRYAQCISKQAALISNCTHHLQTACQSSDVRVVKTVRAAMSEMDMLFRTSPNFRLVHLIRDPRGVVYSRRKYPACRGIGKPYDATREAHIYCRNLLRDIDERRTLEARWVATTRFDVGNKMIIICV